MKDKLHQTLAIGDTVVSHRVGSTYKGIVIATITAFTAKQVRTSHGLCVPFELVKINEQLSLAKSTNPEFFI